jgi:pimeloyl-ACP methyl ester carboxylesterase
VFSHDAELALQRLDCPTLFLVGEQDSLLESDKRASKLVGDATLRVLPGARDRPPYFEPEIYVREVLEFVCLR